MRKIIFLLICLLLQTNIYAAYSEIDSGYTGKDLYLKFFNFSKQEGLFYLLGDIISLDGDKNFGCAIDQTLEMKCWLGGKRTPGIEGLKNPKQVSVGSHHMCVLDDEGVKCKMNPGEIFYDKGQAQVPDNLVNPKIIATGNASSCAIDDEGVKCWGNISDEFKRLLAMGFKNPNKIFFFTRDYFTMEEAACISDDFGNHCSGAPGMTTNLRLIKKYMCHAGKNDVFCPFERVHPYDDFDWSSIDLGNGIYAGVDFVIARFSEKPELVRGFDDYSCVMFKERPRCWGNFLTSEYSSPLGEHTNVYAIEKNLIAPLALSNVNSSMCFLDRDGIHCFPGGNKLDREMRPNDINPTFIPFDQSKYFYVEKAQVLTRLQENINEMKISFKDFSSVSYLQQEISTQFLNGMNTSTVESLRENSQTFKNFFISNNYISLEELKQRNDLQLRFVLSAISYSLTSSKYLLSSNSKNTVDKLNLEFANVLSEDVITIDMAKTLLDHVIFETQLMDEMHTSYRLVGIKTFWDWAKIYITTGDVQ